MMARYQRGTTFARDSGKKGIVLTIFGHLRGSLRRRDLKVGRGRPSHRFSLDPDDAPTGDDDEPLT